MDLNHQVSFGMRLVNAASNILVLIKDISYIHKSSSFKLPNNNLKGSEAFECTEINLGFTQRLGPVL